VTYLGWGTYRRFAGCAYSLGKTHSREAKVLFSHVTRGAPPLPPANSQGGALPHKIPPNPQWPPRWATNGPRHAQKPPPGQQIWPEWHQKVTLGPLWAPLWRRFTEKVSCCGNIRFYHGYSTQNKVQRCNFPAFWPPNATPGAHKRKYPAHVLPKCTQGCSKPTFKPPNLIEKTPL